MMKTTNESVKEGYMIDYISGKEIKATPEEVEAVQVFSKQLVEDYGYDKNQIQTRPQFRVKSKPSDQKKEYPVDIAIFENSIKNEDHVKILVECKKKTRKDGMTQLQNYLTFSKADLGVWFNGDERLFIRKIVKKDQVSFEEIPNIPRKGQRFEDIGRFKRKDLKAPHNLKVVFRTIKNHLAGNFTGATRDEELAKELINLIFCKIYDEKFTKPDDIVNFRRGVGEELEIVKTRILNLFQQAKDDYNDILDVSDVIQLDKHAIAYIVGELQNYCLIDSERDIVADAFETFIGYALKGSQGQFFTPRNVVKLMVDIIDPQPHQLLIDPACGSGGFLVESLRYMWKTLDKQAQDLNWNDSLLYSEKLKTALLIRGIEKDHFLSQVTKAYMAIIGDGKGGIFCEDSLNRPMEWKNKTQEYIGLNQFEFLLTNPPFGKDIKVFGEDKLKQYNLAYHWKKEKDSFEKTDEIKKEETPQIIFIERSIQLLKDGGKLGIVLPETFLHAPKSRYVLEYMLKNNNVTHLIDLPHNTFRPYNNAKCISIILEKNRPQQELINMAVAEEIGHDHQGKKIYRWNDHELSQDEVWDDIPFILEEMKSHRFNKYCFQVKYSVCYEKKIFVPRYYWQDQLKEIEKLAKKEDLKLISIEQLLKEKVLIAFDGHGSPPAEYKGKGEIPYIRVKDIVNWEIYKDPTSKIPKEIYLEKKGNHKNLQKRDIVFVRRGSYRIGSVAMVSPYDTEVLLTREILVLRIIDANNQYGLTPEYLLYLLSHKFVSLQSQNKVLIETTLPNIGERWKELQLPISNSQQKREELSNKIQSVIENKWQAIERINELKKEFGDLTT